MTVGVKLTVPVSMVALLSVSHPSLVGVLDVPAFGMTRPKRVSEEMEGPSELARELDVAKRLLVEANRLDRQHSVAASGPACQPGYQQH